MSNEATKELTPTALANQLFDAALVQYKDPREAARQIINFLSEALVYAVTASAGDENARKALLKTVGDRIASPPQPTK